MILYHNSKTPLQGLTDQPLFLSATEAEARAWEGDFVYFLEVRAEPTFIEDEHATAELASNPTGLGIYALDLPEGPLLSFLDYDPRNMSRDTLAFLLRNPMAYVGKWGRLAE